ncbi:MAG: NAD(P)H-dependent oxidoreductase subunit E [Clostridia bacterium]|nr:NAD(P)H-dependent oxidoreductase subunit E [Clostridia bacterium]
MIIKICIGSSCHLKGSPTIVELATNAVQQHQLADRVTITGSFCIGKCNRTGVTVQVDDDIHVGVTAENFQEFFQVNVLNKLGKE